MKSRPPQPAPTGDASLGKVLDFMRLLWEMDHALQSTSKRMATTIGVTGPQRLTVRFIGREPGISAGALADRLHLHPSTMTGVLKRLEDRGLIERRVDPEDARRSIFHLTRQGLTLDEVRTGTVEAGVRRAVSRLTPAQLSAARHAISLVVAELAREG
jgi:MarR family transcriptional regulator, organic hydroperoxide resistance regulator